MGLPRNPLVLGEIGDHLVNETKTCDHLHPFLMRNNRWTPLHGDKCFVSGNSDDEIVASFASGTQNVQMADMEHVESTRHVAD